MFYELFAATVGRKSPFKHPIWSRGSPGRPGIRHRSLGSQPEGESLVEKLSSPPRLPLPSIKSKKSNKVLPSPVKKGSEMGEKDPETPKSNRKCLPKLELDKTADTPSKPNTCSTAAFQDQIAEGENVIGDDSVSVVASVCSNSSSVNNLAYTLQESASQKKLDAESVEKEEPAKSSEPHVIKIEKPESVLGTNPKEGTAMEGRENGKVESAAAGVLTVPSPSPSTSSSSNTNGLPGSYTGGTLRLPMKPQQAEDMQITLVGETVTRFKQVLWYNMAVYGSSGHPHMY